MHFQVEFCIWARTSGLTRSRRRRWVCGRVITGTGTRRCSLSESALESYCLYLVYASFGSSSFKAHGPFWVRTDPPIHEDYGCCHDAIVSYSSHCPCCRLWHFVSRYASSSDEISRHYIVLESIYRLRNHLPRLSHVI